MERLTALEAHKIANSHYENEQILSKVLSYINETALRGEYEFTYTLASQHYMETSSYLKEELGKLGYKVTEEYGYLALNIRW